MDFNPQTGGFVPAGTTDLATLKAYLEALFAGVEWSGGQTISLLGIGEKGTPKEGVFRERKFIDPSSPFMLAQAEGHMNRWGQNGIASFIVPAVLARSAEAEGDVKLDKVVALTSIVVDIDSGDTLEKLDHAREWLGEPSLLVHSGGVTECEAPKSHAYWMLDGPSSAIAEVARLRKLLAAKIGGDQSFGRATQVIRVPGSIYGKGGAHRPVRIVATDPKRHALEDLAEAIESMEWMDGEMPTMVQLPMAGPGMMDFSAGAGVDLHGLATALVGTVHEGGEGDATRWSTFNKVAGHYIHCARRGEMTVEEARDRVYGWMIGGGMEPAWPDAKFTTEWTALLNKDLAGKGVMQPPPSPGDGIKVDSDIKQIDTHDDLMAWSVTRCSQPTPPPRRVFVDGLVFAAKRHMFVAEGGAGKTFLLMDLALKLAAASPEAPLSWMGQHIRPEAYGGHVILITGEDDRDELDLRWQSIDPDYSMRAATEGRLITLPMDNLGGAFPLVAYHPQSREPVASERWLKLYGAIKEITTRGGWVSAIIIDTLNSTLHGEENSASIIGEYVRAVAPICGDLKAAMIVSHHVRKPGQEPIRDLDDMKAAIRGSTALPNAMRVVIGLWHAHDWQKQMKLMGFEPQRGKLYCAGVVKSNMPALDGVKYLLRSDKGVLADVTLDAKRAIDDAEKERIAWLVYAIRKYRAVGKWFTATAGSTGVYANQEWFPEIIQSGKNAMDMLAKTAVDEGFLFKRLIKGATNIAKWLDLPECSGEPVEWQNEGMEAAQIRDWSNAWYDSREGVVKEFQGPIHGGER